MTVAVKNKPPVVVPESALRRAGFKRGQELEVRASGGVITILPKLPTAGDEYTPEQRRIIDARLAEGAADIKAGRVHGPFTAKQAAAFIERISGKLA
jgi:bifunctional DNA-binding transcriptional regulator/antitoxin component of YhaV-PrlF toxin-antitoxin module